MTKRVTLSGDDLMERQHWYDINASQGWALCPGATVIKRIELVNFMSHERTVIEPAAGLTVLVGPNNCGKSAFVTALQILCHNAKSNYVMRHGEKQCEIIVETDDGHIVNWSKKKSGGAKYVIDGQEYDRLRQGIPSQLHEILGLSKVDCDPNPYDIHFGEQKSPVFLLNDSGRAAAQFFASSSDAIRLVEMQSMHKNRVRDAKRDQTRLESEKQQLTEDSQALEPLADVEKRIGESESLFKEIHESAEKIEHVGILIKAISAMSNELDWCQAKTASFESLAEPPEFGDSKSLEQVLNRFGALNLESEIAVASLSAFSDLETPPKIEDESKLIGLVADLEAANRNFEFASASSSAIASLKTPPKIKDESELSSAIGSLKVARQNVTAIERRSSLLSALSTAPEMVDDNPLQETLGEISKLQQSIAASEQQLKQITSDMESLNTEVEAWVEQNPSCPTCGNETTVDQVIGAGGHRHG